jgi:hypothetical protein
MRFILALGCAEFFESTVSFFRIGTLLAWFRLSATCKQIVFNLVTTVHQTKRAIERRNVPQRLALLWWQVL